MDRNDDDRFDEELMAKAARLATEVSPERDLWPGIEQVIAAPVIERRPLLTSLWAQAAAIVLLVGGSSGLTYLAMTGDESNTVPSMTSPGELVFEPVSGSFGSQYNLGPDYIDARRVVSVDFEEHLADLSPEARQAVETNVETIRNAITEINRALAEDPDNVLLQELLIETYRDELNIMKRVNVIAGYATVRNDI